MRLENESRWLERRASRLTLFICCCRFSFVCLFVFCFSFRFFFLPPILSFSIYLSLFPHLFFSFRLYHNYFYTHIFIHLFLFFSSILRTYIHIRLSFISFICFSLYPDKNFTIGNHQPLGNYIHIQYLFLFFLYIRLSPIHTNKPTLIRTHISTNNTDTDIK